MDKDMMSKAKFAILGAGAFLCSLISFACVASAHFKISGHKTSYTDSTALEFDLVAGILLWLWTIYYVGILVCAAGGMEWANTDKMEKVNKYGNLVATWFSYTAGVAAGAYSSDCDAEGYDDETDGFCGKIAASAAFMFLAFFCFLGLVMLEMIEAGGNDGYTFTAGSSEAPAQATWSPVAASDDKGAEVPPPEPSASADL